MIKKQWRIRAAAVALAVILMLSVMTPFALAAGASSLGVSRERFFADTLYFSNGTGALLPDGSVQLSFDGGEPSVAMDVAKSIPSNVNSLRVVIDNVSLCDKLIVEYIAKSPTSNVNITRTVECEIVKGHGLKEYIIPIDDASSVTSLRLTFNGAVHGEITIASIGFLSYFSDGREYCGELTKAEYDHNTKTALIQGTVSWEAVSSNPDAKIVVYKLSQNESFETIEGVHSYIAWSDISLNFSIKIDIKKNIDSFAQYALAVLTDDGRVIPIDSEFYLSVKKTASNHEGDVGFKGMETSMFGGVIDGNGKIAYVDVNLGRLFGDEENGFQYIFDGVEYYVDNDYVAEIDAMVNAYRTIGIHVYLRLLVDGECGGVLFSTNRGHENGKYYAIDLYDGQAFAKFAVYTEYIISRYSGNISGVVFGRSLDKFNEYSYSDTPLSLDEYSKRLAKLCAVIRNIIDKYGNVAELIVPVSDADFGVDRIITDPEINGSYPIDVLASSFLEYMSYYSVPIEDLYFMMESECAPIGRENSDPYEAIDNCADFEALLIRLNESFSSLPTEFVYCWYASAENISNNYIYNYNVAANTASVKSFVVSLSDLGESEREAISSVSTAFKFSDTDKASTINGTAIGLLGFASWGDLIEGFEENNLIRQDLTRIEIKNSIPSAIIGSYDMWDFERGSSALGWRELSCNKLSVSAVEGGTNRALAIVMSKSKADGVGSVYGSAVYSHDNPMNVKGISGISFDVFIPKSEEEKIYEIVITIESGNATKEFSGVIFDGSSATLYADIQDIDVVKAIEINTREISSSDVDEYKVYVKNIAIHSNEYGDSALERLVVSGSITDSETRSDVESKELAEAIVIAVIIVSLMIIWGIWLFYKASKAI
jgi:hypothetical protein